MKSLFFKFGILIMTVALVWSCGKDDGPTPTPEPTNTAPKIENQSFNAAETITDTETIGEVTAEDKDGDDLTFGITADSSNLFEITEAGVLSLQPGKSLDFDAADSYTITVAVTDGKEEATATVTITVGDKNTAAPVFGQESYEFEAQESISEEEIIGTIEATDADASDELTFAISENDNELFEINNAGELSLALEMNLDFETDTEHSITVSVTDGTETVTVDVSITVTDMAEAHPDDKAAFVTTWQTDNDGDVVIIGANQQFSYDFTINWGDGTIEQVTEDNPTDFQHIYEVAGVYTVAIQGDFPAIYMKANAADKLLSMEQWGTGSWKSLRFAFQECANMTYNATDIPDISMVEDMTGMFFNASLFNGDISGWNTSNVTNMSLVFFGASSFNQSLNDWDVGSVTVMDNMFRGAESFNGNIGSWNTVNVTNMSGMFQNATGFEGAGLENWNVSNVTNMSSMFSGATAFNGNINGWTTSSVTNMNNMFFNASSFNRNIGTWDIGNVDPGINGGMANMLSNSGMSPVNYSATLIGWEAQENVPSNISLGAQGLNYCQEAEASILSLILKSWNIDDDGLADQCGL